MVYPCISRMRSMAPSSSFTTSPAERRAEGIPSESLPSKHQLVYGMHGFRKLEVSSDFSLYLFRMCDFFRSCVGRMCSLTSGIRSDSILVFSWSSHHLSCFGPDAPVTVPRMHHTFYGTACYRQVPKSTRSLPSGILWLNKIRWGSFTQNNKQTETSETW